MNDIAEQRPLFFEGEYLSASDLEQLVIYLRDQSSRHLVGGHTWGIVAGLQLLEQAVGGGAVDMFLLPGYAIDGYGRPIVVVNPVRFSVDRFNGQPSGPVQVWLRYDEGQTNATRPGFQVCCNGGDAYSRVAESYDYEVGFKSLANQQAGISVGGETVDDARTALRVFNDAGQIVCDASVPYQDLPLSDETKSYWLIPLGEVGWQAGTPGQFVSLSDPASDPTGVKIIHSRRVRRYAGVVAENVYASDNLIRLRRRNTDVGDDDPKTINLACGAGDLTDASHDHDFANCADGAMPNELVWVEGKMRVVDDVRVLSPGRIELRDSSGTSYEPATTIGSTPTFLQRTDHKDAGSNNADLEIVIGKALDTNTHNRLLIETVSNPKTPAPCASVTFDPPTTLMSVLDNGNVGIGTDSPTQLLDIKGAAAAYIELENTSAGTTLFLGAGLSGGVIGTRGAHDLRFRTGGADPTDDGTDPTKDPQTHLSINPTGQVGVGTFNPDPANALTVEADGHASALFRTADQKHEGRVDVNAKGIWLVADSSDDSVVLSTGADTTTGTVWVKPSGNVGIGTSTPAHRLGIEDAASAQIALLKTGGPKMVLGSDASGTSIGSTTNHDLTVNTNNLPRVTITAAGLVGIGTDNPLRTLDVNGDIRLGANPHYLVPGGYQNWVIVPGSVNASGTPSAGQGFSSAWSGVGRYTVTFNLPLATAPIVMIQLVGAPGIFGVPSPYIEYADNSSFVVKMDDPSMDYAFNFTAYIAR
jgi:hypothetical protein